MKPLLTFISGMALMYGLQHFSSAEAETTQEQCLKPYTIEWHVDYSGVDDIGLKKLSLEDVESFLEVSDD